MRMIIRWRANETRLFMVTVNCFIVCILVCRRLGFKPNGFVKYDRGCGKPGGSVRQDDQTADRSRCNSGHDINGARRTNHNGQFKETFQVKGAYKE